MGNHFLYTENFRGRQALRLDLGSCLNMQSIPELTDLLREAASKRNFVIIDASAVETMSTSAVQVFLAARRALAKTECEIMLRNPSMPFLTAFDDCGVSPEHMKQATEAKRTDG